MVDKSKTNQLGAGALNPDANQDHSMPVYDSDEVSQTERLYKGAQDIKRAFPDNPETGEYIGIVMRVDGDTHQTPSNGILFTPQNIASEGYLNQNRVVGMKLLQLRIRIPKIHSMLITPETNPSVFQNHPDNEIIDMYPLFLAKEENMPKPNPGEYVWVRLTNRNGKFSGIYTGIIKQDAFITEQSPTKSPKQSYEDNCPGSLSTLPASVPAMGGKTQAGVSSFYPTSQIVPLPTATTSGKKTACKYGKLLGSSVSGKTKNGGIDSTTGGYQSYKSAATKVEIFTAIPNAPPGWNIKGKDKPLGLIENRVRKFAFDALPKGSSLLESLPEGGNSVHTLLAKRIRAMNKYWSDTVLSKVKSKSEQKKMTGNKSMLGLWNSKGAGKGWRPQLYENNYEIYKTSMLLEAHTGPGNKYTYANISVAKNRKAFQSAHETGLGVDFTTNGQYTKNSNEQKTRMNNWAFQWLVNHAWLFGLYSYSGETWHWELLPTREAWETGRDFVNIYDPSSGIWVGNLPASENELTELYKKNPLLRDAVELGVPIYESIPYRSIGVSGFGSVKSDPFYQLSSPNGPIHFPYAVMVRETLMDNGPDDGRTTTDSRWGWTRESNRRWLISDGSSKEKEFKIAQPSVEKITEEEASLLGDAGETFVKGGKYYHYTPSSFYKTNIGSKKPGEKLKVQISNNTISKEIYFGWSKNNE